MSLTMVGIAVGIYLKALQQVGAFFFNWSY
jgi:hypothetical protein